MRNIMKNSVLLLTALTAGAATWPAPALAKLCEEPAYKFRSLPRLPGLTAPLPGLLNEEEKGEEGAGRRLSIQPGPYGHSELGFRYLSRLFGYEGEFDGRPETVERWLAEEEVKKPQLNRGLRDRWNRWVVNAPRRLSVPVGPVRKIPNDTQGEALFKDLYEQDELNRCVAMDIAALRCENSTGERLRAGHTVYYQVIAVVEGKPYCRAYWHGSVEEQAPMEETRTETSSTTMKNQLTTTTTTTKKEWKRRNEGTYSNGNLGNNGNGGEQGAKSAK